MTKVFVDMNVDVHPNHAPQVDGELHNSVRNVRKIIRF
jgi:hypothetical protein